MFESLLLSIKMPSWSLALIALLCSLIHKIKIKVGPPLPPLFLQRCPSQMEFPIMMVLLKLDENFVYKDKGLMIKAQQTHVVLNKRHTTRDPGTHSKLTFLLMH